MSKISFELDETYTSKLTSLAKNTTIEDKAKEIVINYLNNRVDKSEFSKPKPLDRSKLGI